MEWEIVFVYFKDYTQQRTEVDVINFQEPRSPNANYTECMWLWASVGAIVCIMMIKHTTSQNSSCGISIVLMVNLVCCVESDYLYYLKWIEIHKAKNCLFVRQTSHNIAKESYIYSRKSLEIFCWFRDVMKNE